jgi:hypothetical protein
VQRTQYVQTIATEMVSVTIQPEHQYVSVNHHTLVSIARSLHVQTTVLVTWSMDVATTQQESVNVSEGTWLRTIASMRTVSIQRALVTVLVTSKRENVHVMKDGMEPFASLSVV